MLKHKNSFKYFNLIKNHMIFQIKEKICYLFKDI